MEINGLEFTLTRKAMKSIRMAIKAPDAQICISAPYWISDREIYTFITERWDWILQNRQRILERAKDHAEKLTYTSGEKLLLFGEEYELQVVENNLGPAVQLRYDQIILLVKPGTTTEKKASILAEWYRKKLQKELFTLMNKWMLLLNEPDITWSIRQMKARWGSCCPAKRSMLFNLELAKHPLPCIEYVVVHEFTHLQERYHNAHFKSLMTRHLPQWPQLKKELNGLAEKR